ncbi:MAG TPA: DNA polymerase IV [Steroidobacteraceae bacterium]|nr:DNA polymerase IV [Steroidobacteraceae bacterium]
MRTILHVDMDAFYASVEERDRPELKGKPLIVGGTGGRGVVAAASYAVRRFGVRSAMPMREALRRCPQAVCVRPRMGRYQEVSAQVFAIFREFTPLVEGLSLDEAFLDLTGSARLLGTPAAAGAEIRRRIRAATELSASVGIAPNKSLAKIASDLAKPDGLYCIGAENLHQVLDHLPIERLFGVGRKSLPGIHEAGIITFGDLARAGDATLWRAFGRHGKSMQARAAGVDERPVVAQRDERSISAEETFAADIRDDALIERHMTAIADRTAARLRASGLMAGRVTVKIRRSDFRTYTRQRVLEPPTQDTAAIRAAAQALLRQWRARQPDAALRLLGVGVADLQLVRQADLFCTGPGRDARLDAAIDGIHDRFGASVLTRASLLPRPPDGSGWRRS